MERFTFRPISLEDIAATIGKKSEKLTITEHNDGTIEVHTPNLTATKRTQLRNLFTNRGFLEDTG